MRATGLGRNPTSGCIEADDAWWKEQNDAMPGCITFRDAPLDHEDQMQIMFDAISVTNETSYVPSNGGGGATCGGAIGEEDISEVERDGHLSNNPNIQPNFEKRPAECSPKGKKSFRDVCMKRLVDAYEKKALNSNNSATSMPVDSVREKIVKMMEQVIEDGAEEGNDEHYYAT